MLPYSRPVFREASLADGSFIFAERGSGVNVASDVPDFLMCVAGLVLDAAVPGKILNSKGNWLDGRVLRGSIALSSYSLLCRSSAAANWRRHTDYRIRRLPRDAGLGIRRTQPPLATTIHHRGLGCRPACRNCHPNSGRY